MPTVDWRQFGSYRVGFSIFITDRKPCKSCHPRIEGGGQHIMLQNSCNFLFSLPPVKVGRSRGMWEMTLGFSRRQQLPFLSQLSFGTKSLFFFFAKCRFDFSSSLNPKHLKIKWLDSELCPLFKPFWQRDTGTKVLCLPQSPQPPFRSHYQSVGIASWLRMRFSSHSR